MGTSVLYFCWQSALVLLSRFRDNGAAYCSVYTSYTVAKTVTTIGVFIQATHTIVVAYDRVVCAISALASLPLCLQLLLCGRRTSRGTCVRRHLSSVEYGIELINLGLISMRKEALVSFALVVEIGGAEEHCFLTALNAKVLGIGVVVPLLLEGELGSTIFAFPFSFATLLPPGFASSFSPRLLGWR